MERSSPLAAMQPPCLLGPWAFAPDPPALARPSFADRPVFGPNSFNFRDLSMKPPVGPADYFTLKPVRGSSPTASLAADLSQNFHIDKRCVRDAPAPRPGESTSARRDETPADPLA